MGVVGADTAFEEGGEEKGFVRRECPLVESDESDEGSSEEMVEFFSHHRLSEIIGYSVVRFSGGFCNGSVYDVGEFYFSVVVMDTVWYVMSALFFVVAIA